MKLQHNTFASGCSSCHISKCSSSQTNRTFVSDRTQSCNVMLELGDEGHGVALVFQSKSTSTTKSQDARLTGVQFTCP